MKYLKRAILHFHLITKHKIHVMRLCFRCKLYKQGILHDMSKYTPSEFFSGCKYFHGKKSPNAVERLEKGYSLAWLHHKGRNKHHWEYWIDYEDQKARAILMPIPYVIEMFCDRVSANMVYDGKQYKDENPYQYYQRNLHEVILHPSTQALIEYMLLYLKIYGLDETIKMIHTKIKRFQYEIDYTYEIKNIDK